MLSNGVLMFRTTSSLRPSPGEGWTLLVVRRLATRGTPCTRSSCRLACTRFGVSVRERCSPSFSSFMHISERSVGSLIVPKNEPEVPIGEVSSSSFCEENKTRVSREQFRDESLFTHLGVIASVCARLNQHAKVHDL